ncbi:MAG: biotin--[Paludibacteraceae bacterium]|nr:biotin--[acetyl-CoA-carboxylase] ligase [Paludibacteraceae bacterium]
MYIASTNSTNTLLRELIAKGEWPEGEHFLYAGYQTAGRGQTGNGWESEAEKNLLCSILLPPRKNLFELNMVVAVAVQRLLGEAFTIKWPNDIYYGDKKVAGILVENAIIGNEIKYSIAGIGLNVNQVEWQSDAPNPVSLKQITGRTYDIDALMQKLYEQVQKALQEDVWDYYKAHLYRREGFWPFVEREVTTAPTMNAGQEAKEQFRACIEDVLPTGEIVLRDQEGKQRKYHFKQIRYVI